VADRKYTKGRDEIRFTCTTKITAPLNHHLYLIYHKKWHQSVQSHSPSQPPHRAIQSLLPRSSPPQSSYQSTPPDHLSSVPPDDRFSRGVSSRMTQRSLLPERLTLQQTMLLEREIFTPVWERRKRRRTCWQATPRSGRSRITMLFLDLET
jgi:hypothetical protein